MKPWYTSRTLLINLFGAVLFIAQEFTGHDLVPAKYLAGALIVLNTILRFITTLAIGDPLPPAPPPWTETKP
jgi:hypothetical protein